MCSAGLGPPLLSSPLSLLFFCSKHLTELDVVAALWETVATPLNTNFNSLFFVLGLWVFLQICFPWGEIKAEDSKTAAERDGLHFHFPRMALWLEEGTYVDTCATPLSAFVGVMVWLRGLIWRHCRCTLSLSQTCDWVNKNPHEEVGTASRAAANELRTLRIVSVV